MAAELPKLPPLLRIPPEIRVQIYEHLGLVQRTAISIFATTSKAPSIARVCQVLREEAMDMFFRRNRFIVSNAFGLAATLDTLTPGNLSRISHLRLNHLGSGNVAFKGYSSIPSGLIYVDIDLLRTAPWCRLTSRPRVMSTWGLTEVPAIVRLLRAKGLKADSLDLLNFEGLDDKAARLFLVLELMTRGVRRIVRLAGGTSMRLNREVLECIVRDWLRDSHVLNCHREPNICDKCEPRLQPLLAQREAGWAPAQFQRREFEEQQ